MSIAHTAAQVSRRCGNAVGQYGASSITTARRSIASSSSSRTLRISSGIRSIISQRSATISTSANLRLSSDIGAASSIGLGSLSPAQPKQLSKRWGRGQGSGRGGTSGRGHKGQKARAGNGKPKAGFEGGQTPITRLFPKRGFTNIFAKEYVRVDIGRVQEWIDAGRIDPTQPITARELYESQCVHAYGDGIRLSARGAHTLAQPVHFVVSRASQLAIQAVEAQGGSLMCKYYTQTSLRALVKPHKYVNRLPLREPDPTHKRDLLYYANTANRGYLSSRQAELRKPLSPEAVAARLSKYTSFKEKLVAPDPAAKA